MGGHELIIREPPFDIADMDIKIVDAPPFSLSDEHNKIAILIYNSSKIAIKSFSHDKSLDNTVKITKTLVQVFKDLLSIAPHLTEKDKKAIAINVGRNLVQDVIPDDKGEKEVLKVYDMISDATLESIIKTSKIKNIATRFCHWILKLFSRRRCA